MINALTNRINTEEEKLFHCIFSYLDFLPFSRRAEDDLLGKTDSVAEGVGANVVNVGFKSLFYNKKDLAVFLVRLEGLTQMRCI